MHPLRITLRSPFEQLLEQRLPHTLWIDRCARRLCALLPDRSRSELGSRAAALCLIADCLPPEEAADIAAGWWRDGH